MRLAASWCDNTSTSPCLISAESTRVTGFATAQPFLMEKLKAAFRIRRCAFRADAGAPSSLASMFAGSMETILDVSRASSLEKAARIWRWYARLRSVYGRGRSFLIRGMSRYGPCPALWQDALALWIIAAHADVAPTDENRLQRLLVALRSAHVRQLPDWWLGGVSARRRFSPQS
ncbi:MAG: hypothetical protein QOD99_611 [Chthoniobacter sp.]|nr:hypothetical protein [Chthoniobacter sp.]